MDYDGFVLALMIGFSMAFLSVVVLLVWWTGGADKAKAEAPEGSQQAEEPQDKEGLRLNRAARRAAKHFEDKASREAQRAAAAAVAPAEEEGPEGEEPMDGEVKIKKMGTKKAKKLEMKEAKAQFRQYQQDKWQKEKEAYAQRAEEEAEEARLDEEERRMAEAAEHEELEALRKARLEKEEAEYQAWRGQIDVEESGQGGLAVQSPEHLDHDLQLHIVSEKIIYIEDTATLFGLTTNDLVEKIKHLLEEKRISGVFDERGRFVYISAEDERRLRDFVEAKGRLSLEDLTLEANRLINFNKEPNNST